MKTALYVPMLGPFFCVFGEDTCASHHPGISSNCVKLLEQHDKCWLEIEVHGVSLKFFLLQKLELVSVVQITFASAWTFFLTLQGIML